MNTSHQFLIMAAVGISSCFTAFGAPHTPELGSTERKALCDTVREHIIKDMAIRPLPYPIVLKVDHLRVDNGFAWFEGFPSFKNGARDFDYLPNEGYIFVLQQSRGRWKIKSDLSRSDVPSKDELVQIRKDLTGVPSSIFPEFWRKLIRP